jgi:hypothetical protein
MVIKWLLKNKLIAKIDEQVVFGDECLAKIRLLLLEGDKPTRFSYAAAVSSLAHDTADKYQISLRSAIYGDAITWRQLGEAIDDWNVAGEAASRLSQSKFSQTAQLYGSYTGHAIMLYMTIYQMKFNQQQFPDLLGEDVSRIFHVSTQIAQMCCDLVDGDKTDAKFADFIQKI